MLAQDLGDAHVGDLKTELEGFALDPTISPAGVLADEAEDQAPELQVTRAAAPMWAPAIGGPFASGEVAMPSEQGLRAGEQG
jgi:hypothetical protein